MASVVIAGDTSGQITLSAPSVSGTTTLTLPATTGTVLNDATVGVCKAWVNFDGSGTVTIRASFNVTSITDNGVGDFTANFTNSLSDANYSATGMVKTEANTTINANNNILTMLPAIYSASSLRVRTAVSSNVTAQDPTNANIAVFR